MKDRIELNGMWDVFVGQQKYSCNIPAPIQSIQELGSDFPSDAMPNGYLGEVWLEKIFVLNDIPQYNAKLVFLGVMPYAEVWLNGQMAGKITCAQLQFSFDITGLLCLGKNKVQVHICEKNLELIGGMRFDVLNWSGIYDDVWVEIGEFTELNNIAIHYQHDKKLCTVTGTFLNGPRDYYIDIYDQNRQIMTRGQIHPESELFRYSFSTTEYQLWSPEHPVLYRIEIYRNGTGGRITEQAVRFGLRELRIRGDKILLNGVPFYVFGGGEEYFSPTISPLRDKEIIRQRFRIFKEMGFNYFRYHTHIPTRAELEVCDELGVFVSVEIPVLSNFNRITNAEKGLKILEEYIIQTRNHPAMAVYCMGNEGTQLLVRDKGEWPLARAGYNIIHNNTSTQLGILCYGYQGETPELPNDFMTPHLWSQEFRWAYQGLTRVPWEFLETYEKPCIVHEYGKYGVWPDDREDEYMPGNGYCMRMADENEDLFTDTSLKQDKEAIIQNSRRLNYICARTSMELMRQQKGISGYIYWTFFRMGIRSGGFCDDMGMRPDFLPAALRTTANAPLGIFVDRGFSGRTFFSGQTAQFTLTVSNFSNKAIEGAAIQYTIGNARYKICDGKSEPFACDVGEIKAAYEFQCMLPDISQPEEFILSAHVKKNGTIIAKNQWEFWCYPYCEDITAQKIIYYVKSDSLAEHIEAELRSATPLWDYLSMVLGCIIPEYGFIPADDNIMEYLQRAAVRVCPKLLITDMVSEASHFLQEIGVPVLYIDSGQFPAEVYPAEIPGNTFFNANCFFSPYRSGWDQGNAVALIEKNSVFDMPPTEGFADLRFYSMIQGTNPIQVSNAIKIFELTDTQIPFKLIQKIKAVESDNKADTVYVEKLHRKTAKLCAYYMEGQYKQTHAAVTPLHFFRDPCGRYMLNKIIKKLLNP